MRAATLTDSFTGSNGAAWDSTKWQALQGTTSGSTSDIQSNSGRMETTGGAYVGIARRSLLARGKTVDALVKITLPTTVEWFFDFVVRGSTWTGVQPSDGYVFEFSASSFTAIRRVATVQTNLAQVTGLSLTSTVQWLRVSVSGAVIRSRIWADGAAEPGTWTTDTTDGSPLDAPGEVGFYHFGGNAAVTCASYIDDVAFSTTPVPVLIQSSTVTATAAATTTVASITTWTDKPEADDFIIAYGARDDAISEASTPTGDSFADSNSDTFTKIVAGSGHTDATGGNGEVGALGYAKVASAWASGTNTVTWTHPSVASRALRVEHWASMDSLRSGTSNTAVSTAGAPSVTTGATNPSAGDAVLAMVAFENSGTQTETADSDTTNGSWSTITRLFTGSSANATTALTHQKVVTQYKLVTATGAQTYNVTNSNTSSVDAVAIVAAFAPQAVPVAVPTVRTRRQFPQLLR